MSKYNNLKYFSLVIGCFFLLLTSCETTELDINVNPNALSPSQADPSLILNGIQASFTGQSYGLHASSRPLVRHVNMFDTYAANTPPGALNGAWANTYSISANKELLEQLNQTAALANHVGVAQVLEAYAFINLVDYIGTAPFSEANNPEIDAPNFDDGVDIYNAIYTRIDEAIVNLSQADQIPFEDLYYNGDTSKWIKLANTLKLRMYVQTKLTNNPNATADVNAIVASGNYISAEEDDFIARFNSNNDNPDARHPDFVLAYDTGAGNIYMSNEFMNILLNDKADEDPRMKYYIYRQTLDDPVNTPGNQILPCEGDSDYNFCYIGDAYWGRDNGDTEGIPNDGNLRSTFGVYPAGGSFDTGMNNFATIDSQNQNLGGAGIFPILTSSFVDFLLAEAVLPGVAGLGTTGSSVALLESGMRKSFAKVGGFAGVPMTATAVDTYVNEVVARYNAATSDAARLEIIIKEFYLASWGNSTEAYNAYRRTGYPNLGGSVITNTDFPRNFLIPEQELNSNDNPNLQQITRTTKVFWDTNPADFIE